MLQPQPAACGVTVWLVHAGNTALPGLPCLQVHEAIDHDGRRLAVKVRCSGNRRIRHCRVADLKPAFSCSGPPSRPPCGRP